MGILPELATFVRECREREIENSNRNKQQKLIRTVKG
jgi:hypothetical protein